MKKRNYDISLINNIFSLLHQKGTVPSAKKPHKLEGKYADCMECHIKPDWLLIWKIDKLNNEIVLIRTGTHADLF